MTTEDSNAPALPVLDAAQARVLGSLIEKAATTPETYPLTLNAAVLACNQKSNREPLMELEPGAVGHALRQLEDLGLVCRAFGRPGDADADHRRLGRGQHGGPAASELGERGWARHCAQHEVDPGCHGQRPRPGTGSHQRGRSVGRSRHQCEGPRSTGLEDPCGARCPVLHPKPIGRTQAVSRCDRAPRGRGRAGEG